MKVTCFHLTFPLAEVSGMLSAGAVEWDQGDPWLPHILHLMSVGYPRSSIPCSSTSTCLSILSSVHEVNKVRRFDSVRSDIVTGLPLVEGELMQ